MLEVPGYNANTELEGFFIVRVTPLPPPPPPPLLIPTLLLEPPAPINVNVILDVFGGTVYRLSFVNIVEIGTTIVLNPYGPPFNVLRLIMDVLIVDELIVDALIVDALIVDALIVRVLIVDELIVEHAIVEHVILEI